MSDNEQEENIEEISTFWDGPARMKIKDGLGFHGLIQFFMEKGYTKADAEERTRALFAEEGRTFTEVGMEIKKKGAGFGIRQILGTIFVLVGVGMVIKTLVFGGYLALCILPFILAGLCFAGSGFFSSSDE